MVTHDIRLGPRVTLADVLRHRHLPVRTCAERYRTAVWMTSTFVLSNMDAMRLLEARTDPTLFYDIAMRVDLGKPPGPGAHWDPWPPWYLADPIDWRLRLAMWWWRLRPSWLRRREPLDRLGWPLRFPGP